MKFQVKQMAKNVNPGRYNPIIETTPETTNIQRRKIWTDRLIECENDPFM